MTDYKARELHLLLLLLLLLLLSMSWRPQGELT